MATQTIMSVPDWARSSVQAYAETAWNLSQSSGPIPVVTISSGSGGSANAVLGGDLGANVVSINIVTGGSNYCTAPRISIISNDDQGSGATAHATVSNGSITAIIIDDQGSNYVAVPSILITPVGTGATAEATVTGNEVSAITVTNGGSGYSDAPYVSISGGGGTGATATAVLSSDVVDTITVTSGGSGYGAEGTTISSYTGPINAPQTLDEIAGINALAARGSGGNQTITDASELADNIIKGDKLTGLPTALKDKISSKEIAAFALVSARIGKKSFYVGDSDLTYLARTLCANVAGIYIDRLEAQLENDNYHAERASMDHVLGLGIDLAKQSVVDAENLRKAGLYVREYLQGTYELSHKLFIEQEELNVYRLEIFGNALRALTGSQQTTTSDVKGASPLMQAVGIVSASAGIYSALNNAGVFTAGTGTAIGAGSAVGGGIAAGTLIDSLAPELATIAFA